MPLKAGLQSAPAFLNPRFHCMRRLPTNRREWREFFSGRGGFCARTRREGKASHRGNRGHRGGFGVGDQNSIGGSVGVCARNQVQQKSIAQRSRRPQRGDWGWWPKFYRWQRGLLGEKSNPRGKHRTVVAEGDWVRGSKILSATGWAFGRELIKRNGQSIVESCSGTRSMRKCKSPHRRERQLGA